MRSLSTCNRRNFAAADEIPGKTDDVSVDPIKRTHTHTHTLRHWETHTRIGACDLCVQCAAVETTRRRSWLRLCLLFSDCECVHLYVCVCVCWLAKSGQWTTLNFGAAVAVAAATSLWPPGRGSSSSCCVSCVVVIVVVFLMLQFQIFLAFTL